MMRNDDGKTQESKDMQDGRTEKLSRRDFTRTTVAVAAVGIPGVSEAVSQSTDVTSAAASATNNPVPSAGTWRKGTTIPAEYYYEFDHYRKDERYVADNFWLLADHVNRIPNTGDYFVFKFGIGESAIVLRDEAGDIRAFHNVCRHRGSRLCQHDEDPKPADERLSVRQLGESGNAKFFRCPYHAWMYDLDGSLMSAYDVPENFDRDANGLVSCNLRVEEGHIFLNFSRGAAPAFESIPGYGFRRVGENYRLADLKIGARQFYPMHANWKLALENFLECYHCGPAHENLVTTHNWDYSLSDNRRRRWDERVAAWLGPELAAERGQGSGGPYDGELNPGFITGSVDGKQIAPLLPGRSKWTHDTDLATTDFSTGYWQAYDDYVAVARFTPRGPELTDTEIWWLVHPDAEPGKDFDPNELMALWDITIKEDAWIVENNHRGLKSIGYRPGIYTVHEREPSAFVEWYMREIVKA